MKATGWAFDRIKEAFEKVAKDEARKLSTAQQIMIRSTDYLRRIIAPAEGQGGVTMSYLCPQCNSFSMEDYVWWVSGEKKHTNLWCASCGEKYDWRALNRHALGGANRRKRKSGQGLQSACSTSGFVRELDQCVEVVGEPARGWRRPSYRTSWRTSVR